MRTEVDLAARAVAHTTLSAIKRPLSRSRFRQDVTAPSDGLKINVGARGAPIPGWINTDVHWKAGRYLDLTKPWPVPPNKVTHVYADNVIEHFPLPLGRVVLRHAFDALAPGGRIRLATPDVGRTAVAYMEGSDLGRRHLERHTRVGYEVWHPVDLLRVTFSLAGHHTGYCFDYAALSEEVAAAGFVDVQRCECGESPDAGFQGLESRATDTEAGTMLIVEGVKPVWVRTLVRLLAR